MARGRGVMALTQRGRAGNPSKTLYLPFAQRDLPRGLAKVTTYVGQCYKDVKTGRTWCKYCITRP